MTVKKSPRTGRVVLPVIVLLGAILAMCVCERSQELSRDDGYVVRINDRLIDTATFTREKNDFFLRWRRDGNMLRKSEEERIDLLVDEIVDRTLIEKHVYDSSGITVTPEEIDAYIDRYIRPRYATATDFTEYLHGAGHENEAELKKAIGLYLLKLKYFPGVAKKAGLVIPARELDSLYRKHVAKNSDRPGHSYHPKNEFADMTLMERFGVSEQYKTWIANIRSKATIEILDPALMAYRRYKAGEYGSAAALYEQVFRERGGERFLAGALRSHLAARNWQDVVRVSRIGMQKYPEKTAYTLTNAEGLYHAGKTGTALKLLAAFEPQTRESVYLRDELARVYENLGLRQEAERVRGAARP